MRLKRKQGVNAILLRGLLLLRLRVGRPIPIVILGLVLGAEKGSDINVSRALAPAGCAGRAGVAAVIFGGSGWALQNSSISLAAVGIVEIPSKIANALPVSSRTPSRLALWRVQVLSTTSEKLSERLERTATLRG